MDSHGTQGSAIRDAHFRTADPPRAAARKSHFGVVVTLLILVVGGIAVYLFWFRGKSAPAAEQAGGRGAGGREVPVVAVAARQGDLPIYLNGLGTVTPFNLVTIRPRVGGQILNIAFKEGQDVKENDLLLEIDPRPFQVELEQAEGQMGRDQALLNNAKADLARYQSAGASVAQQQIDTAAAQVRQYEAVVKSDQGGIDSAKLNLAYCRITAPISGRIGLRRVDVGNVIQANDQTGLAVITQLQPIAVVFSISQDDAAPMLQKSGGGVGLEVSAFDRGFSNKLADGVVEAVDNQIDPTTGTIKIKATFKNETGTLFPSQFVNARLLLDTMHNATLIPAAAVQRGPDNQFVYVVKSDQTVEVRPVKIGQTTDDVTAVDDGVKPGDVVVTDGVDKLQPGAKVAVRERNARGSSTQPGASTQPGSTTQPSERKRMRQTT